MVVDIAAGIVLYNPDLVRLKENIDEIYNQVKLIVLIDNKSNNITYIKNEFSDYSKIIFVNNESNLGIAKALNQIMNICSQKSFSWVLLLDQDSVCPPNIIQEYNKYIMIPNAAIITPLVTDRNSGDYINDDNTGTYKFVDKCITSASLTNVQVWKEVGGFDEVMFIDLVDMDYCKRVIIQKYKIVKVNTVILLHEIGHITNHRFFFRKVKAMNHSAFRKYYMARNMLYFSRKHKTFGSTIQAYMRIFKLITITLLFEGDKKEKIKKIFQGIHDSKKMMSNF